MTNLNENELTTNNEVCVWEQSFGLHQGSRMARVEHVKDPICIYPYWSVRYISKDTEEPSPLVTHREYALQFLIKQTY